MCGVGYRWIKIVGFFIHFKRKCILIFCTQLCKLRVLTSIRNIIVSIIIRVIFIRVNIISKFLKFYTFPVPLSFLGMTLRWGLHARVGFLIFVSDYNAILIYIRKV